MAPYALTPTTERDEPFGGIQVIPQNGSSFETSDTPTPVRETSDIHNDGGMNDSNSQSAHIDERTENSQTPRETQFDGNTPAPSGIPYKDAYVDGYTEGYTEGYKKSHIELKHQPIAIIGMSCRFPGSVSTPDEFWELLARSRTGFSSIPESRFSANRFFHPNPGKSGTTNARGGNFLTHDLAAFDAPFFGFTQQEAISLDPQQRLLLECTFEALEAAGIPKHEVIGEDVGVFVGGTFSEYEADSFRDPDTIPMHQATGCAMAMQSNRVSHFFDFRGPSYTVDTACSSSLVALHSACQSLRTGESTMAIAAGVHLNMLPEFWISYSMSRLFGEAGKSYAFDQRGTGYGRGEGCGLVLMKPLDQAIKDNDPIRAVITGSGINQDGKTPGITMPNGSAQEALIRSVYKSGGMDPCDTGYIEAHGTGTRVGDPIEVGALQRVFGEGRNKRKPLYIGSVKSNIGHLEAAAGIAGVIKTAMMLERGFILPNYDFKQPNENIPFDKWGLKVPIRQQPWPFGKRWASVNGFGFGGTNGHVVMTRGPLERKTMKEEIDTQISERLFVLSANDKVSTEKAMQNLGVYLEQRPEVFQNDLLSNLAYTLGQRKSLHPWRIAVTASSSADLVVALSCGKVLPCKQEMEELSIGWVFTGQGAQWWAMGRELYEQYPVYTAALDRADSHLRHIGADFSLVAELAKDETTTLVNAAYISQPSCTAVQLALVDLLRSWGLRPSAVVGHSSGEIGAAYAAGLVGFEDAMTIAYHRGRLIPILKKKYPALDGCMMAVGAGESQIGPLIDRIPLALGQARIACINSPSSVTISGDSGAVDELKFLIEETYPEMFVRKLQVDTAYHSHHMNLVAKEYTESLRNIELPKTSGTRFYSSLLGRLTAGYELDASYWVQNLTCPVRFDEAVQAMCLPVDESKTGVNLLVELGPHAALQGPIKQILKHVGGSASKIGYASVLSRKKNAVQTALSLAGSLFVKGVCLDMGAVNFPKPLDRPPQVLIDMPRYSWNHSTKFYHESRFTKIHKFHDTPRNDIIGVLAPYSSDLEPTWRNIVRLDDLPWLRHHQMQGVTLFPIAGFLVMALEAAAQTTIKNDTQYESIEVKNLVVKSPAMLTEEELEMTITLRNTRKLATNDLMYDFVTQSWCKSKGWAEHCIGEITVKIADLNEVDGERVERTRNRKLDAKLSTITQKATQSIPTGSMYEQLSGIGVFYGPSFQGLQSCHAFFGGSVALLSRPDTAAEMPHHAETNYILHPALIEQLISMYWPIFSTRGSLETVHLPSFIGKTTISLSACEYAKTSGCILQAVCELSEPISEFGSNSVSMFALNSAGKPIVAIEDLHVSPIVEGNIAAEDDGAQELCYKLEWEAISTQQDHDNQTAGQLVFDADIVIIHGSTELQFSMASALASQINDMAGIQPTVGTLAAITTQAEDKLCIFLTEIDQPFLASLDAPQFESLQRLLVKVRGVLWMIHGSYAHAKDPTANMVVGLSRTLRSEGTLMKFITLELDGQRNLEIHSLVPTITRVFEMTLGAHSKTEETEFLERDGLLFTPRIVNDHELNSYVDQQVNPSATEPADFSDTSRPLRGKISVPGVIDSLAFEDDKDLEQPLLEDYIEFHVKAIGVNTADAENSSTIGLECSGVVTNTGSRVPSNLRVGDHVAAVTIQGSLSAIVRAHYRSVIKIPDHISFEMAATTPISYCNAVYALIEQARLSEDESILIHDAASAVGQAALSIAQMVGANIWTTVRTKLERDMIMQEFGIPEERVWFTASEIFAENVLDATDGLGVEVVFNTLPEAHLVRATWTCLAKFGRMVNVGAACSFIDRTSIGKNASVLSADIKALAKHRPQLLERTLAEVGRMARYGKVQPVHLVKAFTISEAIAALHSVHASGIHGKAVIVPREGDFVAAPRVEKHEKLLRHDATYILIGGTGGLGRSMAKWMISKGAKHLVLLSRSGVLKGKAKEQIDALNESGANIVVRRCDVADRADVEDLISTGLVDMPSVRGIIHGAMVLHDVLFERMTYEQYTTVIASKVQGAWNFYHSLSAAKTCLDFFIVISSAAGAVGNRGQAAYAAANTFLNGFAQHLLGQCVLAASIDLTAVSDAGYLAEDAEKAAEVARNLGSDTICEAQVLALIQAAIDGKLVSCNGHPITGMRITPTMRPFWSNDAKFVHLLRAAEAASASSLTTTTVSCGVAFKAAQSRAAAEEVVCDALVQKIAEVVSMEPEELDITRPISHYPLDSLTAIEVRNFITRMFEANLQVLELLASGSIQSLAKVVCTKTKVGLPEV